jgi:hypothetical protein
MRFEHEIVRKALQIFASGKEGGRQVLASTLEWLEWGDLEAQIRTASTDKDRTELDGEPATELDGEPVVDEDDVGGWRDYSEEEYYQEIQDLNEHYQRLENDIAHKIKEKFLLSETDLDDKSAALARFAEDGGGDGGGADGGVDGGGSSDPNDDDQTINYNYYGSAGWPWFLGRNLDYGYGYGYRYPTPVKPRRVKKLKNRVKKNKKKKKKSKAELVGASKIAAAETKPYCAKKDFLEYFGELDDSEAVRDFLKYLDEIECE